MEIYVGFIENENLIESYFLFELQIPE